MVLYSEEQAGPAQLFQLVLRIYAYPCHGRILYGLSVKKQVATGKFEPLWASKTVQAS